LWGVHAATLTHIVNVQQANKTLWAIVARFQHLQPEFHRQRRMPLSSS